MYNQVSATGKKLIYNPGQTAGSCFNAISAASVNFEGTASSFLNWPASEWGRTLGSDRIYLFDPLGNLVLAYSRDPDIKALAKDLTRLLTASRIG